MSSFGETDHLTLDLQHSQGRTKFATQISPLLNLYVIQLVRKLIQIISGWPFSKHVHMRNALPRPGSDETTASTQTASTLNIQCKFVCGRQCRDARGGRIEIAPGKRRYFGSFFSGRAERLSKAVVILGSLANLHHIGRGTVGI